MAKIRCVSSSLTGPNFNSPRCGIATPVGESLTGDDGTNDKISSRACNGERRKSVSTSFSDPSELPSSPTVSLWYESLSTSWLLTPIGLFIYRLFLFVVLSVCIAADIIVYIVKYGSILFYYIYLNNWIAGLIWLYMSMLLYYNYRCLYVNLNTADRSTSLNNSCYTGKDSRNNNDWKLVQKQPTLNLQKGETQKTGASYRKTFDSQRTKEGPCSLGPPNIPSDSTSRCSETKVDQSLSSTTCGDCRTGLEILDTVDKDASTSQIDNTSPFPKNEFIFSAHGGKSKNINVYKSDNGEGTTDVFGMSLKVRKEGSENSDNNDIQRNKTILEKKQDFIQCLFNGGDANDGGTTDNTASGSNSQATKVEQNMTDDMEVFAASSRNSVAPYSQCKSSFAGETTIPLANICLPLENSKGCQLRSCSGSNSITTRSGQAVNAFDVHPTASCRSCEFDTHKGENYASDKSSVTAFLNNNSIGQRSLPAGSSRPIEPLQSNCNIYGRSPNNSNRNGADGVIPIAPANPFYTPFRQSFRRVTGNTPSYSSRQVTSSTPYSSTSILTVKDKEVPRSLGIGPKACDDIKDDDIYSTETLSVFPNVHIIRDKSCSAVSAETPISTNDKDTINRYKISPSNILSTQQYLHQAPTPSPRNSYYVKPNRPCNNEVKGKASATVTAAKTGSTCMNRWCHCSCSTVLCAFLLEVPSEGQTIRGNPGNEKTNYICRVGCIVDISRNGNPYTVYMRFLYYLRQLVLGLCLLSVVVYWVLASSGDSVYYIGRFANACDTRLFPNSLARNASLTVDTSESNSTSFQQADGGRSTMRRFVYGHGCGSSNAYKDIRLLNLILHGGIYSVLLYVDVLATINHKSKLAFSSAASFRLLPNIIYTYLYVTLFLLFNVLYYVCQLPNGRSIISAYFASPQTEGINQTSSTNSSSSDIGGSYSHTIWGHEVFLEQPTVKGSVTTRGSTEYNITNYGYLKYTLEEESRGYIYDYMNFNEYGDTVNIHNNILYSIIIVLITYTVLIPSIQILAYLCLNFATYAHFYFTKYNRTNIGGLHTPLTATHSPRYLLEYCGSQKDIINHKVSGAQKEKRKPTSIRKQSVKFQRGNSESAPFYSDDKAGGAISPIDTEDECDFDCGVESPITPFPQCYNGSVATPGAYSTQTSRTTPMSFHISTTTTTTTSSNGSCQTSTTTTSSNAMQSCIPSGCSSPPTSSDTGTVQNSICLRGSRSVSVVNHHIASTVPTPTAPPPWYCVRDRYFGMNSSRSKMGTTSISRGNVSNMYEVNEDSSLSNCLGIYEKGVVIIRHKPSSDSTNNTRGSQSLTAIADSQPNETPSSSNASSVKQNDKNNNGNHRKIWTDN